MTRRIIAIVLAVLIAFHVGGSSAFSAADSGTFRGKWWNYYDRAVGRSAESDYAAAVADLKKSLELRDRDQIMARTYGMHFIDYFPHRELGVIYYLQGNLEKALPELETSYRQQESAKAAFYLNLVRKSLFLRQGRVFPAPEIIIDSPAPGASLSGVSVKVSGRIKSKGLVARTTINGRPLGIELAVEERHFEQEVQLEEGVDVLTVAAADLLGKVDSKSVTITVDRDGPAFCLDRIYRDGALVRLSGNVEDRTGIAAIMIAGKNVATDGSRSQRFDISISSAPGKKIEFRTIDAISNETAAEIDPDWELASRSSRKPILLAAAGPFALFDRQPPNLLLRETADPPTVFVDRYYVEGEAQDDGGIDRIVINGHEVTLARGKKVYFSKVVKLAEGANLISVEAYDRAGNRSQTSFSVRRTIPAALQVGSRMVVTLLPFDGPAAGESAKIGDSLLTGAFVEQKRFQIIDREKLLQVLREQKLSREKLTDADQSIRLGRLIAAEAIIASAVREDKRSLEVVTRIINTETGEVMDVKDVYTEDKSLASVREQMEGLAAKIAGNFPVATGMVISRDRKEVLADVGAAVHIRKSTGVVFYRRGKEIRHQVTGRSLGWDTIKLGEGRFEEVQREYSRVRLTDPGRQLDLAAKDLLITR